MSIINKIYGNSHQSKFAFKLHPTHQFPHLKFLLHSLLTCCICRPFKPSPSQNLPGPIELAMSRSHCLQLTSRHWKQSPRLRIWRVALAALLLLHQWGWRLSWEYPTLVSALAACLTLAPNIFTRFSSIDFNTHILAGSQTSLVISCAYLSTALPAAQSHRPVESSSLWCEFTLTDFNTKTDTVLQIW